MSKKFDLAALKQQFKQENNTENQSTGSNFYPFWGMEVGESVTIRFLPDLNDENPRGFLRETMTHTLEINGQKRTFPCLKTWDKNADCPCCKVSAQFYSQNDKINGKKFWRSTQYIGNVLVVSDPLPPNRETNETFEGKVKPIRLGTKIYAAIQEEFESGAIEEVPFDYEEGTNFIIKKTKNGEFADYSRSRFDRKPSSLDPDTIEMVQDSLVDLETLLPAKPTYEKIEAFVQAALNGGSVDTSDSDDDDEEVVVPTKKINSVKEAAAVTKTAPKVSIPDEDDDDDEDEEALKILERIKTRNKG
jgi:hypothetical protein